MRGSGFYTVTMKGREETRLEIARWNAERHEWYLCGRYDAIDEDRLKVGPQLMVTTKGFIQEDLLERREGVIDNEMEHTTWTEWWFQGELVKRGAHVTIKEGQLSLGQTGG